MAWLQEELTGKASELEDTLRDLERLRAAMAEKEEGLGSATGHIESLGLRRQGEQRVKGTAYPTCTRTHMLGICWHYRG